MTLAQKGSEFCIAGSGNSGLFGANSSRPVVPRQRNDLYLITKYKTEVIRWIIFPECSILLGMNWGLGCLSTGGFCNGGWSCAHLCLWYLLSNYMIISVFYHSHKCCMALPSHHIQIDPCLYSAYSTKLFSLWPYLSNSCKSLLNNICSLFFYCELFLQGFQHPSRSIWVWKGSLLSAFASNQPPSSTHC